MHLHLHYRFIEGSMDQYYLVYRFKKKRLCTKNFVGLKYMARSRICMLKWHDFKPTNKVWGHLEVVKSGLNNFLIGRVEYNSSRSWLGLRGTLGKSVFCKIESQPYFLKIYSWRINGWTVLSLQRAYFFNFVQNKTGLGEGGTKCNVFIFFPAPW